MREETKKAFDFARQVCQKTDLLRLRADVWLKAALAATAGEEEHFQEAVLRCVNELKKGGVQSIPLNLDYSGYKQLIKSLGDKREGWDRGLGI